MSTERDQLVCNARDCFKKIEGTAWITCCSHVFCAQHGKDAKLRQTTTGPCCPACGTRFRDELSIVERQLNSSLQARAKQQVCANLERKLEYYREMVCTMKRDGAQQKTENEVKIRRLEQQLEQAKVKLRQLDDERQAAKTRFGEPSRCVKKRKPDDFLL
ncbi:E3 ubiquitin-protein ligase CCNB1IP1 isoform X2 [Aedes aegypti]|uniref:RING-type domain-containing protein n=1 Tax=Aedes aegypti TaxID=7159 RepID=A0A6I8TKU4_AEDAE|nr:E3 ubiquitin-protein ligase CCNB1IP1 isoform X2 [Aedes aegypti]